MSKSRPYAGTNVSTEKSQGEITTMLRERGCSRMAWDWSDDVVTLRFLWPHEGQDLTVRFDIRPAAVPPSKRRRTEAQERSAVEQSWRESHRVLRWYLKSMFEAADHGLFAPATALLGWVETESGETLGERMLAPSGAKRLRKGAP